MNDASSDMQFLNAFETNFSQYKKLPIVFYGIGAKTRLILENIQDYSIVGLMDRDTLGNTIYGHQVLCYDEVIAKAKLIIIVANLSVVDIIYRRIAFLQKQHNIKILYINGESPQTIDENIQRLPYWRSNAEDLKAEIENHDIISFDLFDTLIMRKVFMPSNIFDLVERALKETYDLHIDFKAKRIEAEKSCFAIGDSYYTIHQIYKTLQELLQIDNELTQQIMQLEFEIELKYCTPRKTMVECYQHALNCNKIVCCTTDTYLPRQYIVELLNTCGITQYEKLFISCEQKKLKYLGDMWQYVSQVFDGKKILHIGDNPHADIEMAQKCQIHTFEIKNACDMISISTLNYLSVHAKSIEDYTLLGQFAAHFLNNPFALNEYQGRLYVKDLFSLGFLSFGPLVLNYLIWLINKSRQLGIEKLLFFSRDGYILEKLYRKIGKTLKISLPEGIYFLTSRRVASVAGIETEKDIVFILRYLCNISKITVQHLLFNAFGLLIDADDAFTQKFCYETTEDELSEYIISNHKDAIFKNAREERKNYLNYTNRLGLQECSATGCVNFVGVGLTQYFLSKIIGKGLTGFYFATLDDRVNIYTSSENICALYGEGMSLHSSKSKLLANTLFGEVIFSSPDEQCIKFDDNAQPIFENREKKRDFSKIDECHAGIAFYIEEMIKRDPNIVERIYDNELVALFYGLFSNPSCICSDEVRQSFVFNDYYNPTHRDLVLSI